MRLIYCTSLAFSDKLANRVQVHSMAKAFQKKMNGDFYLGVDYINADDKNINIVCLNAKKSYILAWKHLKFIKENKITHAYCREARLLFFIILYNKIFYHQKLKFIYEVHTLLSRTITDKIIDKRLTGWADNFVFITKKLQERYLKKYSGDFKKSIVASDCVDLPIFDLSISKQAAREKLNLPIDKKILIYTGHFKTVDMDKGILDILKAIKMLDDQTIKFLAIGGTEKEINEYGKIVHALELDERVNLLSFCPQDKLAIYQKASDALLMPFPYNEHYAFYMSPMKMFEYMASKRPIIASDLPSVREVLNENNAFLIEPDSPDKLAQEIKKVLDNQDSSAKIAQQAFADVHNYTWEKRVEKILDFIQSQ